MNKVFMSLILGLFLTACGTGGSNTPPNVPPTPVPPVEKFNCQNPNGGIVNHGDSVVLFKDSTVTYGNQCVSEVRVCNNGTLTGTATHAACKVLAEQEPSWHELPMQISDEGLKMGGTKLIGETSIWKARDPSQFSPAPPTPPACSANVVLGQSCSQGASVCAKGDKHYFCDSSRTFKVWGWIYEKHGVDYSKMAEGVTVGIYGFVWCMQGGCDYTAGPVKTDKFGYFEFTAGSLFDTLKLEGMPKYYAYCNKGKPVDGGGQNLLAFEGKAIGPFKQNVYTPGVCDQNFVMKLFAEEKSPENTNDVINNSIK